MKTIIKVSIIYSLFIISSTANAMPSAAPAKAAVAQKSQPKPIKTGQAAPVPITTIPSKKNHAQKIIENIKKEMTEVNTIKDGLKNKLKELDIKLHEARRATVKAKKISFQILRQENQRAARDTFDKVKENLNAVKTAQAFVQGAFTQDFNQRIAKFNTHIANLQSKVQTLAAVKPPTRKVTAKKLPQKNKISQKSSNYEELSLTGKIMQQVTDILARMFQWIRKGRDWLLKSSAPTPEPPLQKKKSLAHKTIPKNIGGMPGATTNHAKAVGNAPGALPNKNQLKTQQISSAQIQAQLSKFNTYITQIDSARIMLSSRYQDVKKIQKAVYRQLNGYPEFDNHHKSYNYVNSTEVKKWKMAVVSLFSSLVDAVVIGITKTVEICVRTYRFFIKPTIKKISDDVQKKLEDLEEKKESA